MFLLGLLLGATGGRRLSASRSVFLDAYTGLAFGYALIVGVGIAAICYAIAPDWMWMYWLDSRALARPVLVYVFLVYPVTFWAGYLAVSPLESMRPGLAWRVFGGLLAVAVLVVVLTFDRIWYVGTLDAFKAGRAEPMIALSPFAIHPVGVVILVGLVVAVALYVPLYRLGKRPWAATRNP